MPELKIDQFHIGERKCNNQFIGKAFKCKTFHSYTKTAKIRINMIYVAWKNTLNI